MQIFVMYVFVHVFPVTTGTVSDCQSPNGADLPLGIAQVPSWGPSRSCCVVCLPFFNIYFLLEFPKQIKNCFQPLPVTRLFPLVQSRNREISRFIGIFEAFLCLISLGNMDMSALIFVFFPKTCWTILLVAVQSVFITMINDKGSFDKHKHMCGMCLCV